jgi:hypothetical protein
MGTSGCLLIDLAPDGASKRLGLSRQIQAFLERFKVSAVQAQHIAQLSSAVGKRRNTFAHSLTRSYWETDASVAAMFTPVAMEDTLYAIGRLAVLIEEIVLNGPITGLTFRIMADIEAGPSACSALIIFRPSEVLPNKKASA